MATKNIVPRANNEGKIGTNVKRWSEGHFETIALGGEDLQELLDEASEGSLEIASQAEAEAGVNNTKAMTPQRTAQAIAVLASGGGAIIERGVGELVGYTVAGVAGEAPSLTITVTDSGGSLVTGSITFKVNGELIEVLTLGDATAGVEATTFNSTDDPVVAYDSLTVTANIVTALGVTSIGAFASVVDNLDSSFTITGLIQGAGQTLEVNFTDVGPYLGTTTLTDSGVDEVAAGGETDEAALIAGVSNTILRPINMGITGDVENTVAAIIEVCYKTFGESPQYLPFARIDYTASPDIPQVFPLVDVSLAMAGDANVITQASLVARIVEDSLNTAEIDGGSAKVWIIATRESAA